MTQETNNLAADLWALADLLRGDFKQSQYGRVILPFALLRRLECVLEGSKPAVLAEATKVEKMAIAEEAKEKLLLRATGGLSFFNTSPMDLSTLGESGIKANLERYIQCFSKDAREIFDHFKFAEFIGLLNDATRRNLFRVRQFYEAYADAQLVTALLTQLPWTHNLTILSRSKRPEEREFYLKMAAQEKWSKRELERQYDTALFERVVLSPAKVSPLVTQIHPDAASVLKDSYLVEFLDLPAAHLESDLQRGLLAQLRQFLLELGRDFCFVGSEYPLQVGPQDFALDLLFFHRDLNCLVAIELKTTRFSPEHHGQLNFYLEALDRDHKKPHENPAIGLLLCASKDDEVVEYALSRTFGTLGVLRHELRDRNARLSLCQFKPEHDLNPDTLARYAKNRLRVVPELVYSPWATDALSKSLDIPSADNRAALFFDRGF